MVSAYTYAGPGQLLSPDANQARAAASPARANKHQALYARAPVTLSPRSKLMASPRTLLLAAAMAAALLPAPASSATYMVGDAAGWDNGVVDYDAWARGKKFKVGDTLGTYG